MKFIREKEMVQKINNSKSLKIWTYFASLAVAALFAANCQRAEKPVFLGSPERLYQGSVHYVQADCASCHGGDWNGKGPDTKNMIKEGLTPTDFTAVISPDKTPVDYFMAITAPADYFKGKKNVPPAAFEKFVATHSFHNMTDRARWAMANFLFSRAPALKGQDKTTNERNYAEKIRSVMKVYESKRRWETGYLPIQERSQSPSLDEMISKIRLDQEITIPLIDDQRKAASVENSVGSAIYRTNCQSCHGKFAQGDVAGPRLGLLDSGPDLENDKGITRRSMAFISVSDLAYSAKLASPAAFQGAHVKGDFIAPSQESLTNEEWQLLYNYTKRLAGR